MHNISHMFEPSHFYPPLISDLLHELETTEIADSILCAYHSKTISDPLLHKIYTSLNYPEIQNLPSNTVISLILQEYMADFPPIYSDTESLTHRKSSAVDFFLGTADLDLELPRLECECKSLTSMCSDETHDTPRKCFAGMRAPKTTPRSRNGLKVLSWKVKEIVERLGSSTYQEVADCLVKELDESEGDMRDEKNIRRRVYDALNVLIAVGMLEKRNKKVEPIRKKNTGNTGEKVQKLREAKEKFLAIKGIIERNKKRVKGFENLFMPFDLVVIQNKTEKPPRISGSYQKNKARIRIDNKFQLFRSDEILRLIDVEYDMAWIPAEINSIFNSVNYDKDIFTIYMILDVYSFSRGYIIYILISFDGSLFSKII